MSSRFWNFINTLTPGTNARAEQVNDNLEQIEAGLEGVANELNRSVRFTDGSPDEDDFQIAGNAAARAAKVIAFNAAGTGLELIAKLINPRGPWGSAINYAVGDVVQAGGTQNLYYCPIAHVSGVFNTDLGAGRWLLLLDNTTAFQASRNFQIVVAAQSPFQLSAGDDIYVDVSAGPVVLVLPASPLISMQSISISHLDGNIVSNPVTINRNGQRIMALLEDMTVNTENATLELGFSDAARGWRLVRGT